jgi:hypothetical protein
MSVIKIITIINWGLISTYAAFLLWAFMQPANPSNDAGGGEMEMAIKGVGAFMLLALIGLNLLSYPWAKVVALPLAVLLLLLVRYIATH